MCCDWDETCNIVGIDWDEICICRICGSEQLCYEEAFSGISGFGVVGLIRSCFVGQLSVYGIFPSCAVCGVAGWLLRKPSRSKRITSNFKDEILSP